MWRTTDHCLGGVRGGSILVWVVSGEGDYHASLKGLSASGEGVSLFGWGQGRAITHRWGVVLDIREEFQQLLGTLE